MGGRFHERIRPAFLTGNSQIATGQELAGCRRGPARLKDLGTVTRYWQFLFWKRGCGLENLTRYNEMSSSCKSFREVGERGREVGGPCPPYDVLPQDWGGTEQNSIVTCMRLRAKTNDRRKNLALRRDVFHGP
ncbi:hypothetical protein TNCV_2962081 [Trichonephila clavipes]|nr:hypothetical protein TNCV_2962081 [Trichonephila clavipes]